MVIRTENSVINIDNVSMFVVGKDTDQWVITVCFAGDRYDYIKIGPYSTEEEAQEMLSKIFLCCDSNRSLDMRETRSDN